MVFNRFLFKKEGVFALRLPMLYFIYFAALLPIMKNRLYDYLRIGNIVFAGGIPFYKIPEVLFIVCAIFAKICGFKAEGTVPDTINQRCFG